MHLITIISLLVTSSLAQPATNPKLNCDHPEIGKQLQCLGALFEIKTITSIQLRESLKLVIEQLPPDGNMFSLNMITSPTVSVGLSRQTHYTFAADKRLILNPLHYTIDVHFYQPAVETTETILIFTTSMGGYPIIGQFPKVYNTPMGSANNRVVYQLCNEYLDSKETDPNKLFETWSTNQAIAGYKGLAVVMPMTMFSPEIASVNFHVVVGEYEVKDMTISGKPSKYLQPQWEYTKNDKNEPVSHGNVPPHIPNF